MRKPIIIAIAIIVCTAAYASDADAQERTGIGFGAETILTADFVNLPTGVATLTYQASKFHVSGLLLFASEENAGTVFGIGGRFYYALHTGDRSDFSLGGGLAILNTDPDGPSDSDTSLLLEGGAKIRFWMTDNVAFGFGIGLGIVLADEGGPNPDNDVFGLAGQLLGSVGVTYFFW